MKVLVIVPCYNAEKFIEGTIKDIQKYHKNILIVDDGSTDRSYELLKKMKYIKLMRHLHNKGKGAALKTGFSYAIKNNFDAVITIDADGQHKASDIPRFITESNRSDIIIGNRMHNIKNMPFTRIIANTLSSFLVSTKCKQEIPDSQSGYRLIKANVLKNIKLEQDDYQMETEMLLKTIRKGYRINHIPIQTVYGKEKSHINPFDITWQFVKVILYNK